MCKDADGTNVLQGIVSWGMNPCGQVTFFIKFWHDFYLKNACKNPIFCFIQYEYPTVFGNVADKAMRDFLITEGARP